MRKKKSKGLLRTMDLLNKKLGVGTVVDMSNADVGAEYMTTGRPELDKALGGGLGVGKMIEVYSENGCGKTGLALDAAAACQKNGGIVAFVDSDHALNIEYCETIGLIVDDLIFSQPDCGEHAVTIIKELVACGEVDLIIIDSIAAMTPRVILEGESGQAHMGVHARLMGQMIKMISGTASDNGTTLIFINQLRATYAMWGDKETTTGGNALKFFASQRIEIKRKGYIKVSGDIVGFNQLIRIVKNKLGVPFKEVAYEIIYGKGLDPIMTLIDACLFEEIIIKNGSHYEYDSECKKVHGLKAFIVLLEDNPDLVDVLQKKLDKALKKNK